MGFPITWNRKPAEAEEAGEASPSPAAQQVEKERTLFVCKVCGKEAKSKGGLAAHMRSHKQ